MGGHKKAPLKMGTRERAAALGEREGIPPGWGWSCFQNCEILLVETRRSWLTYGYQSLCGGSSADTLPSGFHASMPSVIIGVGVCVYRWSV